MLTAVGRARRSTCLQRRTVYALRSHVTECRVACKQFSVCRAIIKINISEALAPMLRLGSRTRCVRNRSEEGSCSCVCADRPRWPGGGAGVRRGRRHRLRLVRGARHAAAEDRHDAAPQVGRALLGIFVVCRLACAHHPCVDCYVSIKDDTSATTCSDSAGRPIRPMRNCHTVDAHACNRGKRVRAGVGASLQTRSAATGTLCRASASCRTASSSRCTMVQRCCTQPADVFIFHDCRSCPVRLGQISFARRLACIMSAGSCVGRSTEGTLIIIDAQSDSRKGQSACHRHHAMLIPAETMSWRLGHLHLGQQEGRLMRCC